MELSFTQTIAGVELGFHRFFNYRGQPQYIVSYQSGTKEEVLLLLGKGDTHHWHFLFKEYVPPALQHLETGIARAIEENEEE